MPILTTKRLSEEQQVLKLAQFNCACSIVRNQPAEANPAGMAGMRHMAARLLLIGAVPFCLLPASHLAQAQTAPGGSELLPAIEVIAPAPSTRPAAPATAARPTRNRNAPRPVTRLLVYPTAPTPMAGAGIDVDKVPASINAVGAGQIERTGSLNIADALQQQVPGIVVNEVSG